MIMVRVTGVDETLRRLADLGDVFMPEILKDLRWFGETVVAAMQEGHPPGGPHPATRSEQPVFGVHAYIDRTGQLTRMDDYEVKMLSTTRAQCLVFNMTPYAEKVEFGTPTSRAYPFFWPNFYRHVPFLLDRIRVTAVRVINEHSDPAFRGTGR